MKNTLRNAVVTLTLGSAARSIATLTHPIMRRYAERCGADFVVISEYKVSPKLPKFQKFQIHDLLSKYQRIIYFDTDIIVMPNCPDLFTIVPPDNFGAFFDSEVVGNDADIPEWRAEEIDYFQKKYGNINWRKTYFNTGVLVLSRRHREVMNYTQPVHRGKRFVDQTQINFNFQKLRVPSFDIGPKFNYFVALNRSPRQFDHRFEGYVLHYAGFNYFYRGRSLYKRIKLDAQSAYRGIPVAGATWQ